jgi:DNA-binding response OmpR family regulator
MAINMGGDDFIQKPFDLNILVTKISALLLRKIAALGKEVFMVTRKGIGS